MHPGTMSEISSVRDNDNNNAFHGWVTGKTKCDVFDTSCGSDKDCDMACHTLHSEDGREITKFVCNFDSGRCNRVVYSADSYAKASRDLANILRLISTDRIYVDLIPENFMWFIKHNNGRHFVDKRAAYYDLMGLALGQIENTEALVAIMERRTAESLRDRLYRQLDSAAVDLSTDQFRKVDGWIRDVTAEAPDTDTDDFDGTEGASVVTPLDSSLRHFLNGVTGYSSTFPQPASDDVTGRLDSHVEEDAKLARIVAQGLEGEIEEQPRVPVTLKRVGKKKLRKEERAAQAATHANLIRMQRPDNLCNERLHAGRAEAIYEDQETKERVAVCTCVYPEYLTGPACHQRTYRFVIDYDKWAKTGWPEFLTDPIHHFEKADDVCRGLGRNATAEYSRVDRAFVCVTIADVVKNSLTFKGAFEPSLVIERDVNKAENSPYETFGPNWKYVNLLERVEHRTI